MALNKGKADKFLKTVQKLTKYLAIVSVLFALAIIFFSIFKSSLKYSNNNQPGNRTQLDDSWNEYSNNSMGMSFKYPKDWKLNRMGESTDFEQITIESDCNIQSDDQCVTVSFYPYKKGVDAIPYYDDMRISNKSSISVNGVDITMFDFDYSPINNMEKIYQFSYKGVNYEVTYYETVYKKGEVQNPTKLMYSNLVDQVIRSLEFTI